MLLRFWYFYFFAVSIVIVLNKFGLKIKNYPNWLKLGAEERAIFACLIFVFPKQSKLSPYDPMISNDLKHRKSIVTMTHVYYM